MVIFGVAEHAGPFSEIQVGGDQHAGVLVQARQQMEQQCAAGLAKGQVAELIEDDEIQIAADSSRAVRPFRALSPAPVR